MKTVNGENTDDTPLGKLMQDFKQPDADKMHSKLLSDRMKYLKSTKEEVTKMCNIVEEYSAKRFNEGMRIGEHKGEHKALLKSIKNLIKKKQYSPLEAMEAIGIEQSQYKQYLALL